MLGYAQPSAVLTQPTFLKYFKTKMLQKWLNHLETLNPDKINLGLDRIRTVADPLKLAIFNCPIITVTGTNGKGSTVALLECLFLNAGYRVGAYTSPHLFRFNERIRIQGEPIDDASLCQAFEHIETARGDTYLTYFEFTTLAAFDLFQGAQLDILILEVGLGGRLDAVNLVDADVAVITTIALDHQEYLGPDRELIGAEKAGILRELQQVICGDPHPPHSLLKKAQALNTTFYNLEKNFFYTEKPDHFLFSFLKQTWQLPIPSIELQNAATALMAMLCLHDRLPVAEHHIKHALETVFLPGRFEYLSKNPTIIVDVAHNPAGAAWLTQRLLQEPCEGKTFAIWSMLGDKDLMGSVEPLIPYIDAWFFAELEVPRAASLTQMEHALHKAGAQHINAHTNFKEAYSAALSFMQHNDKLLAFGSFHTVGAFCNLYRGNCG